MDQLKKQLSGVLQYGFWIGCVVVLGGSLGVWYMTVSDLDKQSKSQVGAIMANVSKVKSLQSELSDQPNEFSHKEMQLMIDERKDEVLAAWKSLYEAQSHILTWPKEVRSSYTDEFRYLKDPETKQFDKTKLQLPFEVHNEFSSDENAEERVSDRVRQIYRRYIKNVLPSIAAIAKTEWTADFDSTNNSGMGGGDMDQGMMMGMANAQQEVDITGDTLGPMVRWSTDSQDSILKALFPWRASGRVPSTLDVYYSQENLWILKQLLQIVSEVNGSAQQTFEAKIREIYELRIGRGVSYSAGSIDEPGAGAAAGGMGMGMEMDMDMEGMDMDMDMGDMGDDGMGGGEASDPGDNRYVDETMTPMSGSELRGKLTSKSPSDAPVAVAKRIPVMMAVQIDQRYVPKLLAACGSAPLMVEVKQMRVLPKSAGGGMQEQMGGGEGDADMDMDMGGGMGGGGMGGGGNIAGEDKDEFPLDMRCEIYGLIYLYNPPDEEALGIQQEAEETESDGSQAADNSAGGTPASTPAGTSGTGATTPVPTAPAATNPATTTPAAADPSNGNPAPATNPAAATAPDPNAAAPTGAATPPAANATGPNSAAPGAAGQPAPTNPAAGQPAPPAPAAGGGAPAAGTGAAAAP